ncbi:thiosulfate oxidation carrier complex protein SoxZ [Billgrantia kenyensis]|uniref:Thiosulfate oxidation carrier complex protein SoxZ n=1 Tax=Billgrantia kenyensis TaxID=321266 RepID=A0A7V9VZH9_9GAMM|nr:thiosulfate oxidation carrier complex protein SoxZ [Halomonas kenyensis]MBA2778289.1 thiosulfate oxidation carrier complex protein SoxZ [Halomonas kenyensis]MCG6660596.1 thiosulfate oxidation carrier complex protein SoxZ [Halomonas kenyensis]
MHSSSSSRFILLGRRLLRGLGVAITGLGLATLALPGLASEPWQRLEAAQSLLGDSEPHTQGLTLDLPHVSEDGSAVALTVSFDGELDEGDYIERVDLFANANPSPEIATFHLSPLSAKPEISTRVRLNETQEVIAIATSHQGERFATAREVRITVSGCLVRAGGEAPDALSNPRVSIASGLAAGEPAEVRTLINHPMETGLREDDDGDTLPRHIIERFSVSIEGDTVFEAELHQSISANPYLRFFLTPEQSGEAEFIWQDDSGETARHVAEIDLS